MIGIHFCSKYNDFLYFQLEDKLWRFKSKLHEYPLLVLFAFKKKFLEIPESFTNKDSHLTTISPPEVFACDHHFQMFLDMNFKIIGCQKVDFEPKLWDNGKEKEEIRVDSPRMKDDKELFENLLIDANFVEFRPVKLKLLPNNNSKSHDCCLKNGFMTLKEVYEEFWEFIDSFNFEFKDFIMNDKRRIDLK